MSEIKYIEVSTGPFSDLKFIGHESAEAYDAEAKEVGACVATADLSDAYRSLLPKFHAKLTPTIETLTGVKRGVNAEATAKAKSRAKNPEGVKDVLESFITFANRAKASASDEVWAQVNAEAHTLANSMKCDSSPAERSGATAGPGKAFLEKADSLLGLSDEELQGKLDKLASAVPNFELAYGDDGRPTRESLAFYIKAWFGAV